MKRQAVMHPKMLAFARWLEDEQESQQSLHASAVGHIELLLNWTAQNCLNGGIGIYTNYQIATAIHYFFDPDRLIMGLITSGWIREAPLPHRLIIVGWSQHADDWVQSSLYRMGEYFADGKKPNGKRLNQADRQRANQKYALKNQRQESCVTDYGFSSGVGEHGSVHGKAHGFAQSDSGEDYGFSSQYVGGSRDGPLEPVDAAQNSAQDSAHYHNHNQNLKPVNLGRDRELTVNSSDGVDPVPPPLRSGTYADANANAEVDAMSLGFSQALSNPPSRCSGTDARGQVPMAKAGEPDRNAAPVESESFSQQQVTHSPTQPKKNERRQRSRIPEGFFGLPEDWEFSCDAADLIESGNHRHPVRGLHEIERAWHIAAFADYLASRNKKPWPWIINILRAMHDSENQEVHNIWGALRKFSDGASPGFGPHSGPPQPQSSGFRPSRLEQLSRLLTQEGLLQPYRLPGKKKLEPNPDDKW